MKGQGIVSSLCTLIQKGSQEMQLANNAATIRIFVKGLKNAYILAALVYEK